MALVCIDSDSSQMIDEIPYSKRLVGPVENQYADSIWVPLQVSLISSFEIVSHHKEERAILTLSVMICAISSIIFGVRGANMMHYLPLYLALMPVIYWLLKITYATALVGLFKPYAVVLRDTKNHNKQTVVLNSEGKNFTDAAIGASRDAAKGKSIDG